MHFFNDEIQKTAQSIRANLISELRFLEFLRDDGDAFSIREWIGQDDPSFLFLTADAEHAAAMRNIISAMLEISANALMSRGPATEPRCYFFLDELPSLNRLPFLISSLAEIRQFGGAFVLGYQVYSQLEDVYGREGAQTISGNTNNRIVFNTPDFRTAKLCSESLGSRDFWEKNANVSVGAHEARDGVGFTQQRVERPVVTAAEIQNLPQLRAYIKFAYESPTSTVDMKLVNVEPRAQAFLPYMGNAPGFGRYESKTTKQDTKAATAAFDDKAYRAFRDWCTRNFRDDDYYDWQDAAPDVPPKYTPYLDHFTRLYKSGLPPSQIQPIVIDTSGLITNTRASNSQKPRQHTPDATSQNAGKPSDTSPSKSKAKRADRHSSQDPRKSQNREPKPKTQQPVQTTLPLDDDWSPGSFKGWEG